MDKKSVSIKIILGAVLASLFVNVFFSRWITAKVSTLPFLNKLNILSPQAPIVITQRQEVRLVDSGTLLEAVRNTRSRLASLAVKQNDSFSVFGTAVSLTNDGLFLSPASVFAEKFSSTFWIIFSDGRSSEAEIASRDLVAELIYIKAKGQPVTNSVNLGSSRDLAAGERVAVLEDTLFSEAVRYGESYVKVEQKDFFGKVFDSDKPARTFKISEGGYLPGSVIVNSKAEVVGLYDGNKVIPSDIIKKSSGLYFAQGALTKVSHPRFGFAYKIYTKTEVQNLGLAPSALVLDVEPYSPAYAAGLAKGDLILNIEGESVNEDRHLEEILERFEVGQKIILTINRENAIINLNLVVGETK